MPASGLLLEIQLLYNQFTKTEKKIADFVTKNPNQVLFMSITDLADICEVADASVHRFCRKIGVKGYQEFKMRLSLSMAADEEPAGSEEDEKRRGPWRSLDLILDDHLHALRETHVLMDYENLERVVNMMETANHIYFFGVGDSLLTAMEARNKFLRIMGKVSCVDDPHMQAMTASMATGGDLIFIISYSGATKDSVYVAELAREAGARLVAITRFVKSPLTAYVDAVLLCGSNEGPMEGGSMGAKLSQLYILDVLFHMYYHRNKGVSSANNKRTTRAVVQKLY